MNLQLTETAAVVLEHLTWGLRVCTIDQLQRVLTARRAEAPAARRLVRRLADAGLVDFTATAVTFPDVNEPLYMWAPGDVAPHYDAVAWQLEDRWRKSRPRRVTVCWATQKAARLCGGTAAFSQHSSQIEHDLGTAGVLTRLHESRPTDAAHWIGEDILRRYYAPGRPWLKKIPDAAIIDNDRVVAVIEFGGQYPPLRLRRFHEHFRKHRLKYELW